MSSNYLPPTRRTSNVGGRPSNDPHNLVKVSNNPLASQAQETIKKLELKNLKDETIKKEGSDVWMSQLDNWKSKRKCVQPRVILDSKLSCASEDPTNSAIISIENPMKHKTINVDDDSEELMQRKSSNHKKLKTIADVSQEVIYKHEQTKDNPTKSEQSFNISADVKPCKDATSIPRPAMPLSQIYKSHSAMSTSLTTSNVSSTPTETMRRSNTSSFHIERPKSSMVTSDAPKVPLKNFKLIKNLIVEGEPSEANKNKTEEKTAQASIKRFTNLKNFFEQAATADNMEKIDSDDKSSKPLTRVKSSMSAVDTKKRMSLGPGVLERSAIRGSIAIANDKEYIIDEHFVEPSQDSSKLANQANLWKEFRTSISPTKKSPTKVLSFSEEAPSITQTDISLDDFKGMILLPTSLSQSRQAQLNEALKIEDEVFATPRICENSCKIKEISLTKESDSKEQNKQGVKYFDDEINLFKSEMEEEKIVYSPTKHIDTILKLDDIKDSKPHPMNVPKNEETSPVIKNDIKDGFNIIPLVEANSKIEKSINVIDSIEELLMQEESFQCPDLIVSSIKVSELLNDDELKNKNCNLKEIKDSQSFIIQKNKETDLDINSLSDTFDKFLEELQFFPSSDGEKSEIVTTVKPTIEPTITLKSKEMENNSFALMKDPKEATKMLDATDGNSSSTARTNVGTCLEKKSQERVMPDVLTFKTIKTHQEGNKQAAKDIQNAKPTFIPKVPPKPLRAQSCKVTSLYPGFSASLDEKLRKKEQRVECDVGIDLSTKGDLNLLDISAGRARVELARRNKRRPPTLFGRSPSVDDLLDSVPLKVDDVGRRDGNGFLLNENLRKKEINQREDISSNGDDDDDDDDDKPPALPSCPPPRHNESPHLTIISLEKFTPVTINLTDSNSEDEMLPESSV